jgi:hypothetical protein
MTRKLTAKYIPSAISKLWKGKGQIRNLIKEKYCCKQLDFKVLFIIKRVLKRCLDKKRIRITLSEDIINRNEKEVNRISELYKREKKEGCNIKLGSSRFFF